MSELLRRVKRSLVDPILYRCGVDLRRIDSEMRHYPLSESLKNRGQARVVATMGATLQAIGIAYDETALPKIVDDFYKLAPSCPVNQAGLGGCGFNSGLQVFVLCRVLQPKTIVESGVYRGYTTWVFRQAVPQSQIYCFDLDFAQLRYRDPSATYCEHDWAKFDFGDRLRTDSFGFFDDHCSQAMRIEECQARGIRHVVFDDNLPAYALHGDGIAAYPTVDMVFDDELEDGAELTWKTHREFRYRVDKQALAAARQRVDLAHHLPELEKESGYSRSNLTYVRLKQ